MAALRQLLNARGTEAKMAALGYQISGPQVPDKTEADRQRAAKAENGKTLQSKFGDSDSANWQHPMLRSKEQSESMHSRDDSYGRSNSFDEYNARPAGLQRTNTDNTLLLPSNREGESAFSMDVSSIYEDNESPSLSPALNKHLALRPLNTQAVTATADDSSRSAKTRRRSRSATQDSQPAYYGTDPWENYRKEPQSAVSSKPRRKESLAGVGGRSASKPPEESSSSQMMRDRNRSPTQLQKSKYDPSSSPPNNIPIKVAHNVFSSSSSPTDGNSISDAHGGDSSTTHPGQARNDTSNQQKRKRSLDYTAQDLTSMDYKNDLQTESFDSFPNLGALISTHNLPSSSLPLADRLRNIYNTPTPVSSNNAPVHPSNDKGARARAFFASLGIDDYEECGDLLLDGFRDVMDRLRQARREKRKAARGMEELVAKREEWVRRKRGVLETELGRLRGAGVAVVKPCNVKGR